MTKTDSLFSMRFSAFWDYISKNNLNNSTIYSLKEYANSSNIYDDYGEPRKKNKILKMSKNKTNSANSSEDEDEDEDNFIEKRDIFIVDQPKHFKLKSDIYCKV